MNRKQSICLITLSVDRLPHVDRPQVPASADGKEKRLRVEIWSVLGHDSLVPDTRKLFPSEHLNDEKNVQYRSQCSQITAKRIKLKTVVLARMRLLFFFPGKVLLTNA